MSYKGQKLSVLTSRVDSHIQELYLEAGIHRRKTAFIAEDGKRITVEAFRFASLDDIHLLAMRYIVTSDSETEVEVHTGIDDNIWNISGNHFRKKTVKQNEEITGIVCETIQEKVKTAVGQMIRVSAGAAQYTEDQTINAYSVHLKAGEPFVMEKYVSICKETDCTDVWSQR